jgi:hypothetical protein
MHLRIIPHSGKQLSPFHKGEEERHLGALSYALQGPENDLEAEPAVETEIEVLVEHEEQEPSFQETFQSLVSPGKFIDCIKVILSGSKTLFEGTRKKTTNSLRSCLLTYKATQTLERQRPQFRYNMLILNLELKMLVQEPLQKPENHQCQNL